MTDFIKNKNHRDSLLQAFLIIIYIVGAVGFVLPELKAEFLPLSGGVLYLSSFVMVIASKKKTDFFIFMTIAFVVGFGAEAIGVNTGYLFGDYTYGTNLGPKFLGVSLVIGILWGVLALASASFVKRFVKSMGLKIILSSLLMLGIDVLMEPVAIKSGFWTWSGNSVPLYNYVCWFLVALFLQWVLFKLKKAETNKVYDTLLVLLLLFFSFLNLYLK
ncbi:carotenoid biosynthesis protein [Crocinitomicaceae bacterium]|jgi:putative membrane protein|nr:carotenoid biosynthesis protein [Crocinitomicaceae bacterium]